MVDQGVEEATLKEVEAGVVEGPIPITDIPPEATLTRRFGVIQSHVDGQPKVRPIDDYKASQVNACVTQTEQVTIHSVDVVAGTVAYWLKCARDASSDSSIMAKCWDLKSAYKQLPLDDSSREMDGHFVIFSPTANAPQVFRQLVLPFGSIASVTGFIRSAMGLWAIAISQLSLVWTMYFDDFLHISHSALGKHSDLIISVFFQLFGWRVSEGKLLAYSGCCKALGVLIDMRQAAFGVVKFTNTESRIAEANKYLEEFIQNNKGQRDPVQGKTEIRLPSSSRRKSRRGPNRQEVARLVQAAEETAQREHDRLMPEGTEAEDPVWAMRREATWHRCTKNCGWVPYSAPLRSQEDCLIGPHRESHKTPCNSCPPNWTCQSRQSAHPYSSVGFASKCMRHPWEGTVHQHTAIRTDHRRRTARPARDSTAIAILGAPCRSGVIPIRTARACNHYQSCEAAPSGASSGELGKPSRPCTQPGPDPIEAPRFWRSHWGRLPRQESSPHHNPSEPV